MPIYVYEVILEGDEPGMQFEVFQGIKEDALTVHPTTGQKVRRVITAPNIAGQWSDLAAKDKLSDANINRLGMTKYVKAGDGYYEKTAGPGPQTINNPPGGGGE
jgi:predicted nucleic acid-binding Zn ribbon protein